MITPIGKANFKIDQNKLVTARNYLLNKKRTPEEEMELLFISMFVYNLPGLNYKKLSNEEFAEIYKNDLHTLCYDYYDYLDAIFTFYEASEEECLTQTAYEMIIDNYEQVFTSVHDFYKSLDKRWFDIFNTIYKERHSTVALSNKRSCSILFPNTKLWVANIEVDGSIEDYVNVVHEYAHGIDDIIANRVRTYSPENIFLELFPLVCQILYLKNNSDIQYQGEIYKCLTNLRLSMLSEAEVIKAKYNLINAFPNVTSTRNLSRLIKRHMNQVISKQDLNLLFSNSLVDSISYTYPYIIALELVNIYQNDPDLFKYDMNYILNSKDHPQYVIKKLNIIPNSIIKMD